MAIENNVKKTVNITVGERSWEVPSVQFIPQRFKVQIMVAERKAKGNEEVFGEALMGIILEYFLSFPAGEQILDALGEDEDSSGILSVVEQYFNGNAEVAQEESELPKD